MKFFRDPQWLLILIFLGMIGTVPLIQVLIEARQDEGVRVFEVFNQAPTAANLRAYERNLEGANWAARMSRPWIQFLQFKCLNYGGEKNVIGREGWYFYKPGLNYMLARYESTHPSHGTNDPLTAIVDFRDQLAKRGIHLLLMPVPNKDSIYPDQLTARSQAMRGVVAPRTRELLEKLRAAHVEVIDLFKEFGDARKLDGSTGQAPLYLAQDTHWSPAGVSLAAKAVARRLKELSWIARGQTEYNERPAPVRRLGDIVRMMQVPQIEKSVAPEAVPCAQVVQRSNGELYKDAPGAEVLVLGDSFMRIFQQDAPNSAGFIAHLARELQQPLLSLVNDGGGSTLVREELQGRPAFLKDRKIVLWEFVERDIGLGLKGWQRVPLPPTLATSQPARANAATSSNLKAPSR